jgi:hypothetical protein
MEHFYSRQFLNCPRICCFASVYSQVDYFSYRAMARVCTNHNTTFVPIIQSNYVAGFHTV